MVNLITDYLRQKAIAMNFVSSAYSLAEIVDRQDGDNNVSFPAVYVNGELNQISFDTHPSLVFFTLDGEIKRETEPGEIASCNDQVTETYKLKCYLFNAGKEISDCASFIQQAAYSLAKFITSGNGDFETEMNLQEVQITATSFNFNKKSVWEELHNGIPLLLSERQQLCRIDFDVLISGVESCFVTDPCDNSAFVYTNSITSFCDRVSGCGDLAKIISFLTVTGQSSYDAGDVADLALLVGKTIGTEISKVELDGSNLIGGTYALVSWDDTDLVFDSGITIAGSERVFILYY